ncbi:MAG TPA: hypothetical protein PKL30_24295 [Leptospiraceae bacterium]|nr:hypothetical protein [Leptospiraceae bacterium]HMW08347.1 hypothetical protein [Leptospiraceae bacterium]HMX35581.1 hypothetical protein [Leptospiraceae bacterium]HMY34326.1 hypothetical protein [Leptospiraceae bacterium]HMZ67510.1 hypothetical protein [Leptospiraceae bacterium]
MNEKELRIIIARIRSEKEVLLTEFRELASQFSVREFSEKIEVDHSRIHKILNGKLDVSIETLCEYIERFLKVKK